MVHALRVQQEFYEAVRNATKKFEVGKKTEISNSETTWRLTSLIARIQNIQVGRLLLK